MLKNVSTLEIRRNLGAILNRVSLRDDQYIIERKGELLAAVVPVWQLKKWRDEKEVFFRMIDKTQQRNNKIPLSVIKKEIGEAIKSVRKNSEC